MTMKLQERLSSNTTKGRRSLAMFLTAGYPTLDATADLVCALEDGGADIVEIGVPFSDPLADGPVIQKASGTAIANGVTLPWILELVSRIRKRTDVPLVLMGYLNPIMRYGVDRFFVDAAAAGVDGLILPELPLEEWGAYAPACDIGGTGGHPACDAHHAAGACACDRCRVLGIRVLRLHHRRDGRGGGRFGARQRARGAFSRDAQSDARRDSGSPGRRMP